MTVRLKRYPAELFLGSTWLMDLGSIKKCPLCWDMSNAPPPYLWEKKRAPNIPRTKEGLLSELSKVCDLEQLKNLTKDELQHQFKIILRGERHPNDCTYHMSSMSKTELESRCMKHGLLEGPTDRSVTRGCMQCMLRTHWQDQVRLAVSEPVPSKDSNDEKWELVDDMAEMDTALDQFGVAKDHMEPAIAKLFEIYRNKPSLRSKVDKASYAYEMFVEAMNTLESSASKDLLFQPRLG